MNEFRLILIIILALFCSLLAAEKVADTINPAFYNNEGLPELHQMTKLSGNTRPQVKPTDLNIVADYFCYSDERFYIAIQTKNSRFPLSARLGTVWYSYMTVIGKPGNEDMVWALMYFNVPLAGLRPGLYRINNKKNKKELIRIGDIEYHIDKEKSFLLMSCKVSDLLSDPNFSIWYDKESPCFGLVSMTSSTGIFPFGTKTVDSTIPGKLIKLKH
jgi:hypothetical protein